MLCAEHEEKEVRHATGIKPALLHYMLKGASKYITQNKIIQNSAHVILVIITKTYDYVNTHTTLHTHTV